MGEDVSSLQGVGWALWAKDLLSLALPFGVVDSCDPVLDFHDDTSKLGHKCGASSKTLGRLDGKSACTVLASCSPKDWGSHTILTTAGVHLESFLIREDVDLDARPLTGQGSNRAFSAPVVRTVLLTIDDVAVVVTSAVSTAIAEELRCSVIGTKLFGSRPEIIDRVLFVRKDDTVRDKDTVNADTLARVGQVEGVVESSGFVGVGKAVKIPVGLLGQLIFKSYPYVWCTHVGGQHNGSLLGSCERINLDVPSVGRKGVSDVAHDLAGEALLAIRVDNREGNRC